MGIDSWPMIDLFCELPWRQVTEKQMRGALVAAYRAMEEWQKAGGGRFVEGRPF